MQNWLKGRRAEGQGGAEDRGVLSGECFLPRLFCLRLPNRRALGNAVLDSEWRSKMEASRACR